MREPSDPSERASERVSERVRTICGAPTATEHTASVYTCSMHSWFIVAYMGTPGLSELLICPHCGPRRGWRRTSVSPWSRASEGVREVGRECAHVRC